MKKRKKLNTANNPPTKREKYGFGNFRNFMGFYSTTHLPEWVRRTPLFFLGLLLGVGLVLFLQPQPKSVSFLAGNQEYWFLLKRASNIEYFYYGIPGDTTNSKLMKTFFVKTGIPHVRPTPLPQLVGRNYWRIIKKYPTDNPETAPYFFELDVPGIEKEPYGPTPYNECSGQCNWILPGSFGLHGVNGDLSRLSAENLGSSGCIRHTDQDITFLYQLLNPSKEEIRYYIKDI